MRALKEAKAWLRYRHMGSWLMSPLGPKSGNKDVGPIMFASVRLADVLRQLPPVLPRAAFKGQFRFRFQQLSALGPNLERREALFTVNWETTRTASSNRCRACTSQSTLMTETNAEFNRLLA
jgi:short subunit dehydrogenase-like uncharacterized protein